jgi:transposase InsO family protein
MSAFKLPSDPSDAPSYSLWRKDAEIWKKLTDVTKAKQGLALQYACRSNEMIHEAVANIESEKVECSDGFKNVMEVLDGLFKTDEQDAEMKAYHDFETIQRGQEQTFADYINQFDSVLNKTKKHNNIMSDNLIAVKLMRGANLTKSQMEIIKASNAKIDYTTVKATMKRMFGESTGISTYRNTETPFIKTEPTFQTSRNGKMCVCKEGHQLESFDEDEEVLHGSYRSQDKYRGNNSNKSRVHDNTRNHSSRGRNRLDLQGNITRCKICDSVNHWATKCPDRDLPRSKGDVLYSIVLFQSDLENPDNIGSLAFETIGAAVADCGASKTVCGREWLTNYIDLLSSEDQDLISYQSTSSAYKFGVGEPHKAFTSAKIPVVIGSLKVFLEVDVIAYDLPLLLSRATMKRAKAHLNTEEDEITMLGETIKLINTSTGHYAIPLCAKRSFINTLTELPSRNLQDKVVLLSADPAISRHEVAVKLHCQFCHPPAEKLIRLINLSDLKSDVDLKEEIKEVTDTCTTCKRFKKTPPRPVVDLPVSSRFNELITMDIKFYHGTPILHLIDTCTRFSVTGVLTGKASKQVIDCIFSQWIAIYGRPAKIISANGEFASEEFRSMAESMGIYVSTTAAESSCSNDICERYNQVLGEMIDKVKSEVDCSLAVAIAWSVSAKNALQNVHGFSPAQLVFGFNPMLPSILSDKPPALSNDGYSDIIARNLNAQKMAREGFTQAESSERIRRALNHNLCSSNDIKYVNGDKVFYKHKDDKRWHGPGTVIGQDGQFVLIRFQSTWIKVHPCKMQLSEESSDYQEEYEPVLNSDKKLEVSKVDSSDEEYEISESTSQTENTMDVVTGDINNSYEDQGEITHEEREDPKPEASNQCGFTSKKEREDPNPEASNQEIGEIKQFDFDRTVCDIEEILAAAGTTWEYNEVYIAKEIYTSQVCSVQINDQVKEAKELELKSKQTITDGQIKDDSTDNSSNIVTHLTFDVTEDVQKGDKKEDESTLKGKKNEEKSKDQVTVARKLSGGRENNYRSRKRRRSGTDQDRISTPRRKKEDELLVHQRKNKNSKEKERG